MTRPPCIYSELPEHPRRAPGEPCCPRWQERLPTHWRTQTVPPHSFRVFREHEVAARRVVGNDATGVPCFCAFDYRLIELRSDDDEEHYSALTYEQSLKAWRLQDGRWLVHRRLAPFGEDGELLTGFTIDEQMPR